MAFAKRPPRRAKRRGLVRQGVRAGGIGCIGFITFMALGFLALGVLVAILTRGLRR